MYSSVSFAFFFFSSRRRHTSWPRDWSSDVCSSDLALATSSRAGIGRPSTPPTSWAAASSAIPTCGRRAALVRMSRTSHSMERSRSFVCVASCFLAASSRPRTLMADIASPATGADEARQAWRMPASPVGAPSPRRAATRPSTGRGAHSTASADHRTDDLGDALLGVRVHGLEVPCSRHQKPVHATRGLEVDLLGERKVHTFVVAQRHQRWSACRLSIGGHPVPDPRLQCGGGCHDDVMHTLHDRAPGLVHLRDLVDDLSAVLLILRRHVLSSHPPMSNIGVLKSAQLRATPHRDMS